MKQQRTSQLEKWNRRMAVAAQDKEVEMQTAFESQQREVKQQDNQFQNMMELLSTMWGNTVESKVSSALNNHLDAVDRKLDRMITLATKQQELDLKERELALRERELLIREHELALEQQPMKIDSGMDLARVMMRKDDIQEWKEEVVETVSRYKCSVCGEHGHNKRKCPSK
jgi:hypothetical protein